MSQKIIIFKNSITEPITITELGITIAVGEDSHAEYEEILVIEDSQELEDFITSGIIIVNDGTRDLTSLEALEYLQIGSNFIANYYNKQETDQIINNIVVNNITNIENQLVEDYYTRAQVDAKVSEVEGYGIKGAVDDVSDLPENYTGNIGDIYIVRLTVGQGSGGPHPFIPDTETGLYLPMENSWQDALGHSGNEYSSMNPVSSPLTPPFGTKYCDFDGHNDWIKFYSNDDFGEGPTLTVGGWIYVERTGTYGIIGRWDDSGNGWKLDVLGNKLRASLDTLSMSEVQFKDSNNITQNQWIHIAMVYDGNYCILYRNATEVNRVSASGTIIDSYNMDVRVGRYMGEWDDDGKYFEGGMKDFFVQNSAMSQEQLQHLVSGNLESFADEGFYQWDGTEWIFLSRNTGENGGGVGSSYHNSLLGLNSEDYQHLTEDQKIQLTDGASTSLHNHDDRYYTEQEVDSKLSLKANTDHTHSNIYTKSEVDNIINHLDFADIAANDTSTNITGSELEQLTNGGNADGLHHHSSGDVDLSGNGLDHAYDNHNDSQPGVGRTIMVDSGPVNLQASNGFPPLRLATINYKPTSGMAGGEICYYDGDLFGYDSTRGKWLSISGHFIGGGINSNNVKNSYLRGYNGTSFSSNVGWAAHWPGTVVSFSITSDDSGSSNSIQIRKNGNSIHSLGYNNQKENHQTNINVDFDEGDVLNFYVDGGDNDTSRPQVWAIIKRRMP